MYSTIVSRYEFIYPGEVYVQFPGKEINVQHSSDDTQEYAYVGEEVHAYPVQYPSEQVHNGSAVP
jgi:hypothetical protein